MFACDRVCVCGGGGVVRVLRLAQVRGWYVKEEKSLVECHVHSQSKPVLKIFFWFLTASFLPDCLSL